MIPGEQSEAAAVTGDEPDLHAVVAEGEGDDGEIFGTDPSQQRTVSVSRQQFVSMVIPIVVIVRALSRHKEEVEVRQTKHQAGFAARFPPRCPATALAPSFPPPKPALTKRDRKKEEENQKEKEASRARSRSRSKSFGFAYERTGEPTARHSSCTASGDGIMARSRA